jgi:hypothetical protein
MIALNKRVHPLVEGESSAETARLFHEIRQTLRLTGVPLPLRALAARESRFPALWAAVLPNAETRAFEEAADRLRDEAVHAAARLDRLSVLGRAQLGESQAFQAEAALLLLHYMDAKLLLLFSTLASALEDAPPAPLPGQGRGSSELIERGAPARMAPLELVDEPVEDEALKKVFRDIRRALGCAELPQDFRVLALWPRYLTPAWQRLKPVARSVEWKETAARLLALSRELARTLPHPVSIARPAPGEGEDPRALLGELKALEAEGSLLVADAALLILDWQAPELARRSPFPAQPRAAQPREAL